MALYQPRHEQQTRAGNSAVTRRSGCTWTSGATGADAATGGFKDRTPDYVHGLVRVSEETNPSTPGWSLPDLALAMKRLNVAFEVRSGRGWAKVVEAHNAGLYIVLQGDSDQFHASTCSGSFDGDHAIGIRPGTYSGRWAIDDPICPDMRTETPAVLRRYAEKLWSTVFFGVFTERVPQLETGHVAVIPAGKFSLFKVADHDQRPLRIVDSEIRTTKGRKSPCSAPIRAVSGAGWDHRPPPDGLVRLRRAIPDGWGYVDARHAREA